MAEKLDPNDPSNVTEAYVHMLPKWQMIETLLQGTEAMRQAGVVYLPIHPEEDFDAYDERLSRTTLYNMLELTLESLVGKPFSEPMTLNDDVPAAIEQLADDIDLQGNNISVFCRDWMREGLAKGFAPILIDFPSMSDEEREARTLEDDIRENRRPYWVLIKPENVIAAFSTTVNGREILTHVRIKEYVTEQNGFLEDRKERIRVLEPGTYQVFEKRKKNGSKKEEWVSIDSGNTGLNFIPMIFFYTNRLGTALAKPPLEDLAYMNVRHWQSTSDQINVLTVARFPMLAVAGATDHTGAVMKIGPNQLLGTKAENGRFYYVEHTGKAIEAGERDLEKLEQDMASYGSEFLRRRPGNQTATERALNSAEGSSVLEDFTIRFIDAVESALYVTAVWKGLEDGGTIKLRSDFLDQNINDVELRTLEDARRRGDLSHLSYIEELRRRGILADNFDTTQNLVQASKEMAVGVQGFVGYRPGNIVNEEETVVGQAQAEKEKAENDRASSSSGEDAVSED